MSNKKIISAKSFTTIDGAAYITITRVNTKKWGRPTRRSYGANGDMDKFRRLLKRTHKIQSIMLGE